MKSKPERQGCKWRELKRSEYFCIIWQDTVKTLDKIGQFLITFRKAGERQERDLDIEITKRQQANSQSHVLKQKRRQGRQYWRCNEYSVRNGIKLSWKGVKVTYHSSDYAGEEDVASGGQGTAVVQEPGGRRWTGFAMFSFYWQKATWWKRLM